MGLISEGSSQGKFPGARDPAFASRCRELLKVQLFAQRPSIVLTLGKWVPPQVAETAENPPSWRGATTLPILDATGHPWFGGVTFRRKNRVATTTVVALTHPARRRLNVVTRRYGKLEGEKAELAMIRDAFRRLSEKERTLCGYQEAPI